MHPRVRGLGQPPRDQRGDRVRSGERPFLQGHLKPAKRGSRPDEAAPGPELGQTKDPGQPTERPKTSKKRSGPAA